MHFQYCSVALQYCSLLVILGILVLANAHGGRSAISRIVVRYALCPLATPAQFKGDGGDVAVAVQDGSCSVGTRAEAQDGRSVLQEGRSGDGLGRDVGKVVSRVNFGDKDAPRLLGVSDHGVTWGHPFGLGGDPLAAGAVDENSGVGE